MEYRRQAKETGGAALIAVFVAGVHVFLGFDQKSGAILGFFAFCGFLIFYPVATFIWNEIRSKSSFSVEAWATTLSAGFILYVTTTISGRAIMADQLTPQIYFLILILSFITGHCIVHVKARLHLRPKLQPSNPFRTVRVDNVFVFALCLTAICPILHATQHLREGQPLDREIYKDLWHVFFIFSILTLPKPGTFVKNLPWVVSMGALLGWQTGQFLWP